MSLGKGGEGGGGGCVVVCIEALLVKWVALACGIDTAFAPAPPASSRATQQIKAVIKISQSPCENVREMAKSQRVSLGSGEEFSVFSSAVLLQHGYTATLTLDTWSYCEHHTHNSAMFLRGPVPCLHWCITTILMTRDNFWWPSKHIETAINVTLVSWWMITIDTLIAIKRSLCCSIYHKSGDHTCAMSWWHPAIQWMALQWTRLLWTHGVTISTLYPKSIEILFRIWISKSKQNWHSFCCLLLITMITQKQGIE